MRTKTMNTFVQQPQGLNKKYPCQTEGEEVAAQNQNIVSGKISRHFERLTIELPERGFGKPPGWQRRLGSGSPRQLGWQRPWGWRRQQGSARLRGWQRPPGWRRLQGWQRLRGQAPTNPSFNAVFGPGWDIVSLKWGLDIVSLKWGLDTYTCDGFEKQTKLACSIHEE